MEDKELQLENGNYTRIINKALDELVKVPLLSAELAICLFVIRKTWGFNKSTDSISLSQFQKGVKRSRPTVVKALKNLQLVNILQLVKVGTHTNDGSEWKFNKYYTKWTLVNTSELVKDRTSTSKEKLKILVKTPKHTKDNTKYNIQKKEEKALIAPAPTPAKNAKIFFKGVEDLKNKIQSHEADNTRSFLQAIEIKYPGAKKDIIWREIQKFTSYWTELNSTGNKERWQKQEAFQVDRRLGTWFGKIKEFNVDTKPIINKYQTGTVQRSKKL